MNRLLVLGASGQDGQTVAALEKKFDLKITYVQRKASKEVGQSHNNCIYIDELLESVYVQILETTKPAFVLNLIGQSSVGKSFAITEETYFANYILAKNLMLATMANSDAHFLQASSAYIFDCSSPINLNSKIKAISPYAKSKALLYEEMQSKRISYFHLFNHVSRYSSLNFVFPKIAAAFMGGYGKVTLELAGLDKSRDWGNSSDYMEIILKLCHIDSTLLNQEYFIGSGLQLSVREIVNTFSRITGRPCTIATKKELQRPHDPDSVIFDKDSCQGQGIVLPSYDRASFCENILNMLKMKRA